MCHEFPRNAAQEVTMAVNISRGRGVNVRYFRWVMVLTPRFLDDAYDSHSRWYWVDRWIAKRGLIHNVYVHVGDLS